ncbi:MAG: LytTR family transcriptional regulator DNA-binding domain-containing protein [Velocimicrobium sp.]
MLRTTTCDDSIAKLDVQDSASFFIKAKAGLTQIYINQLEFAEVIGKTIFYHFTDASVIKASGTMLELEEKLRSQCCFIKPHRSYIINMEHIDTLSEKEIKMQSLALVPIAKANFRTIKLAYIAFSFKETENQETN